MEWMLLYECWCCCGGVFLNLQELSVPSMQASIPDKLTQYVKSAAALGGNAMQPCIIYLNCQGTAACLWLFETAFGSQHQHTKWLLNNLSLHYLNYHSTAVACLWLIKTADLVLSINTLNNCWIPCHYSHYMLTSLSGNSLKPAPDPVANMGFRVEDVGITSRIVQLELECRRTSGWKSHLKSNQQLWSPFMRCSAERQREQIYSPSFH